MANDTPHPSDLELLRSTLHVIEFCRLAIARMPACDEATQAEIVTGLSVAEIGVRRLLIAAENPDMETRWLD